MLNSKNVDNYVHNQSIFINDVIAFISLLYVPDEVPIDKVGLQKDFDYIVDNNLANDDIIGFIDTEDNPLILF